MPPPPLVALQGVTVTFGGKPLFDAVDLAIARGDKLCLVGRNASGKSTLLRLLTAEAEPDRGLRVIRPGTRIGHLVQDPDPGGFETVLDFVLAGLPAAERVEAHRADAVLDRLGLEGGRPPATLSGGGLRRAALARALVCEPDVLLLDEPTNHLDLPTIEWLEAELEGYRGGLLIISHDRAFLSRLGHRTLWLDRGRLVDTGQSFARFGAWQEETLAAEESATRKMDARIASELLWMREGLSARRRRNMGRVRALQQMRRDRAEQGVRRQAKLDATEAEAGGRVVIEADAISKRFEGAAGPRTVLRGFSTRILRGDRVGIIGPNGAGKTTLIRLLTGELAPDTGVVRLGTRLEVAVFDQKRAALDPEATLRQTLCPFGGDTVAVGDQRRHVAGYLGDFLFESGRLESPVKTLSGGERNRLLLAKLFAVPSNLLVMDEPTNDLDMETLDVLEDMLGAYQGTLLLVSHDRDFLDRLVTATIALEGDGQATEYPGGYADYLAQRPVPPTGGGGTTTKAARAEPAAPARPRRKLGYQQQRELDGLPDRLEALQAAIKGLETALADPGLYGRDGRRFEQTNRDLEQRRRELAAAEDRWLELEALREELDTNP